MCPAVMLANNRTITRRFGEILDGFNQWHEGMGIFKPKGTPGVLTICFQ